MPSSNIARMFEVVDRDFEALNAAHARLLVRLGELDETEGWAEEGATSLSAWLRGRYGLTKAVALEWARVARALRSLPAISNASASGALSFEQLRPLTKFATADTDSDLARWARDRSAPELWEEARRHERVTERDHEDAHRTRGLWTWWNDKHTELSGQFRVGAEQGTALENALLDRSEQVVAADEPSDRTGARMADALVELVTESGGEPAPTTLVVHAEASVLTNEASRGALCEAEDGTRIPTEAVRRLACDARIEWSLERNGRPVGIGRRGRTVPGAMGRALRFRDRGCVFPGCGRIRWLKAHHIVHWAHGGTTDLDNLVLVCHAHHRMVHEGGWSIRGRPGAGGELRFLNPRGREPFLKQATFAAA